MTLSAWRATGGREVKRVEILNLRNEALDPNAEGPPDIGGDWVVLSLDEFFRFAELVAAAEREKYTALLLKCFAALESGRPDIRNIAIERLQTRLDFKQQGD